MPYYRCDASFCGNNSTNVRKRNLDVTFHVFPQEEALCQKWIKFCQQNENWRLSKNSSVCSQHFNVDDYQLAKSPLIIRHNNFRRLKLTAIPSVFKRKIVSLDEEIAEAQQKAEALYNSSANATTLEDPLKISTKACVNASLQGNRRTLQKLYLNAIPPLVDPLSIHSDSEHEQENSPHNKKKVENKVIYTEYDHETEPTMLEYRDKFCRVCLNHYDDGSLIPIESQIQDMTVLDMIIELTSLETEHSDAYPTVICLQCRDKLEEAYSIRTELIAQTELLMALVAEQQLANYFESQLIEADESSDLTESMKLSEAIESVELVDQTESLESADPSQLVVKEDLDESVLLDINDHSGYTKALNHNGVSLAEDVDDVLEGGSNIENVVPTEQPPVNRRKTNGETRKTTPSVRGNYRVSQSRNAKQQKLEQGTLKEKKMKRPKEEVNEIKFSATTCYICNVEHDTVVNRDLHMREHVDMLPFLCTECCNASGGDEGAEANKPPVLKTTNQLNRHFMMHRRPLKCDQCYRRFCTTKQVIVHVWDSHGAASKGLTCEYCGKQFFRRILFRAHVSYHRIEQCGKYKCRMCGRSFGSKDSLRRHEGSHTGEKKFKCMFCDKMFSTSYNRVTHQRIHTGDRPYKCLYCDRAFADSTQLWSHQDRHHRSEPTFRVRPKSVPLSSTSSRCPYSGCDYTATSESTMYMHKKTKHMSKYQCEVCNKSFGLQNKLKIHMMLHTGEKPYQCELCERRFRLRSNYRKHMQTHEPNSIYECTVCQKTFKLAMYLRAHMLTHDSSRKYSCQICDNNYKTNGELTKHIRQKHGEKFFQGITEVFIVQPNHLEAT